jgi:hypothetical protein
MSGPACVPLGILAIFVTSPGYLHAAFAATAIGCAAGTCFAVWRYEHNRVVRLNGLLLNARQRLRALPALRLIYDDEPSEWSKQAAFDENNRTVLVIGAENAGNVALERCQIKISCRAEGVPRSSLPRKLSRNTACPPFTLAADDVRPVPVLWMTSPNTGDESADPCVFHYVERNGAWQEADGWLVLTRTMQWEVTLHAISASTRQLEKTLAVAFVDGEWTIRKVGNW